MNIIESLNDRELFGGMFDAPTWRPWLAFLRAIFALPMDEADLVFYRRHTARTAPPARPSRYAELVVGRRGGKSRILGLIAAFLAAVPDHTAHVVPGENPVIAVIAADRKQARVIKSYVTGLLRSSPLLAELIEDDLAETVRLSNGVFIEIHTASIGAPRGRTFLAILCDETAFWPMGDSANPDVEVINAVRPGLSTIPYSLLLIASSPYAKRGVLYTNYAKYFGRDNAPVLVWQGTTEEMNANLVGDPLIAEMYEEDPERASAEYGAQFRSDIVAFIDRAAVEACLAHGVREIPPGGGISYVGHVDPSGGSADSFTLAIAHMQSDGLAVLDAVRERKPPFSPDEVTEEFATLLKSYGINRVTGDAYAGEWPRERFAAHGVAYDVSKKNTSAIYSEFLPALNGRRVQLLDLPRLVGQLVGLERRTARAGRDSIAHAPGSHDDVANAACGALVHVISDRRPSMIHADDLTAARPAEHDVVAMLFATTWLSTDGMCGWTIFSYNPHGTPPLIIAEFDLVPWSGRILPDIVARLDTLFDAASNANARQHAVRACILIYTPAQLVDAARVALLQRLGPRFAAGGAVPIFDAQAIMPELVADPNTLIISASGHIEAGRVKLGAAAVERSKVLPILGMLTVAPGEPVLENPLRVAALLGAATLGEPPRKQKGAALVGFS